MARAPISEIEKMIQSTGFYKNKARGLKESSQAIVELHEGKVPVDLEKLTHLRGVGRKTANVVLGNAFGIPSMVVDTHVGRLARRMGFTRNQDPVKVEQDLMEVVPRKDWTIYSHLMIDHGRSICTARKAHCDRCPIARLCPKVGV
jgi:endonuclease-3